MRIDKCAIKENKTKINGASIQDVCDTSERNKTGGCPFSNQFGVYDIL